VLGRRAPYITSAPTGTAGVAGDALSPLSRCYPVPAASGMRPAREGTRCRIGSPSVTRSPAGPLPRRAYPAVLPAGSEAGFITGEQLTRATGIA
jgi:hypothetical protein